MNAFDFRDAFQTYVASCWIFLMEDTETEYNGRAGSWTSCIWYMSIDWNPSVITVLWNVLHSNIRDICSFSIFVRRPVRLFGITKYELCSSFQTGSSLNFSSPSVCRCICLLARSHSDWIQWGTVLFGILHGRPPWEPRTVSEMFFGTCYVLWSVRAIESSYIRSGTHCDH